MCCILPSQFYIMAKVYHMEKETSMPFELHIIYIYLILEK